MENVHWMRWISQVSERCQFMIHSLAALMSQPRNFYFFFCWAGRLQFGVWRSSWRGV